MVLTGKSDSSLSKQRLTGHSSLFCRLSHVFFHFFNPFTVRFGHSHGEDHEKGSEEPLQVEPLGSPEQGPRAVPGHCRDMTVSFLKRILFSISSAGGGLELTWTQSAPCKRPEESDLLNDAS